MSGWARFIAVLVLCGVVRSAYASGWYEENVPEGMDLYTVEFKWKEWPPGTYFAFWNGRLFPKGGTYYGGLPSGPAKGEVDYHPGLIWSFWNDKDYGGKIARAIYSDPDMYAHQYGGEGMCGGLAGDHLPWLRKDHWYRMMTRVWRPLDPDADFSYFGWWCKDLSNQHWRLLGVFQIPCVATGLQGNSGFFELLSEKQERRFLARRNGYYRLDGQWGLSPSMTVRADDVHTWLAELSDDGRVAEFMHSKNPADVHNVAPGEQKTITTTQPALPQLDALVCEIVDGVSLGNQVSLRWIVPPESAPALRYEIRAYSKQDGAGEAVADFHSAKPFLQCKTLDTTKPARSARLIVTDVFDRQIEKTVNLTPIDTMASVDPGVLISGLQYRYYPSETDLESLPDHVAQTPAKRGYVNDLDIHLDKDRNFSVHYDGYIHARKSGLYRYSLQSCDGSILSIDGQPLIDNNGLHSTSAKSRHIALEKGYHPFALHYFKGPKPRYRELQLFWEGPDQPYRKVSGKDFFHNQRAAPNLNIEWRKEGDRFELSPLFTHFEQPPSHVVYYRNQQRLGKSLARNIDERFNMAPHGELISSGAGEPGHANLSAVADGNLNSFFYMAGGSSNAITLDLKKIQTVETVFTQWFSDGTRSYAYDIEVSTDGVTWVSVAHRDAAVAEAPDGNVHRFKPIAARYLRLAQIRNSANESIHLAEMMVFAAGTPHLPAAFTLTTQLPEGDHRIWARATSANGDTVDSPVYDIDSTSATNTPFTITTLGEKGLPSGVSASGGSASFIGEGRTFMWQKVTGDFELTTQIERYTPTTLENGINYNSWIGLAVMDVVDERWPLMGLYQTSGKQIRSSEDHTDFGGTRLSQAVLASGHSWLRLVRKGNRMQCFTSADGVRWQKVGEKIFRHLQEELYAGALFRTIPYLNRTLFSASIRHIRLSPSADQPLAIPEVLPIAEDQVLAVIQDPMEPARFYARGTQGVLRSTDMGQTWTPAFHPFDKHFIHSLVLDPRDNKKLIMATRVKAEGGVALSQVHYSNDRGETWRVVLHAFDLPDGPGYGCGGDVLAFNPSSPDMVALGTANGLFLSRDGGQGWAAHGYIGQRFSTIAFSTQVKDLFVAGSRSDAGDPGPKFNVYINDIKQSNPRPVLSLDDFHVQHIAFDAREHSMIHLATNRGLFNTWNRGATFFQRGDLRDRMYPVSTIAVDREAKSSLTISQAEGQSRLLLSEWGVLYRPPNPETTLSLAQPVTHLLKAEGERDVILLVTTTGIFRSANGGLTFSCVYESK
jgi:hypothetical protein